MSEAPRSVLDTHIVIAGLLWNGPPRRLLQQVIDETLLIYSSPTLIDELSRTLARRKFTKRIAQFQTSTDALVNDYLSLVNLVIPAITPRIVRDPDDDHVIAAAIAARATLIVSGDHDLLDLGHYQHIRIISAAMAVAEVVERR